MVEFAGGADRQRNQTEEEVMIKDQRRSSGVGRTIGVFALGAAAGSVLALLYAPASGKVTRKRIAMKLRTLKQTTVKQISHLRNAATERVSDARHWVMDRFASSNGHKKPLARRHPAHHAA